MTTPKIENKIAALKKEYEEKYAAELDNVKNEVESILEHLNEILDSVEEGDRAKIVGGAKIKKLIAVFGIESASMPAKKEKKKSRTSRAILTEDAVKDFIGEGSKTKSELAAHFKGGNTKVGEFLDAMVKANHLKIEMTKSKKNKDVTNYKVK